MALGANTEDIIQIIDGEYSPMIYDANVVNALPDVIYCRSKGELNGNTTLEMKYPIGGINSDKIAPNKILMVKVNNFMQTQPMRITSVNKSLSGAALDIKAEHLTNDLRNFVPSPLQRSFAPQPLPAYMVGSVYFEDSFPPHVKPGSSPDPTGKLRPFPFTFDADTDLTIPNNPRNFYQYRMTLLEFLGGRETSLLDLFGGEFLRDRHSIKLKKRLGSDKGFKVEYGLNMTDLDMTVDLSSTLYGVAGFIQYTTTGNQGQSLENVAYSYLSSDIGNADADPVVKGNTNSNLWNATNIEWLDMGSYATKSIIDSNDFVSITKECRRVTEKYVKDNPQRFQPTINLKINFVDLANKTGYEDFQELKKLELGDDVTIQHKDFGIDVKTRFISYEYDFLTKQYTKLELGQPKTTFLKQLRSGYDELYYKAFNLQGVKLGK